MAEALGVADTRRLHSKPQDLNDAYGPPSNFLEIDIFNPHTVGVGRTKYTTYEVRMRVSTWPLPCSALAGQAQAANGAPGCGRGLLHPIMVSSLSLPSAGEIDVFLWDKPLVTSHPRSHGKVALAAN